MKFTGIDPRYFHAANIVIHLINVILVFFVTKKLSKSPLISVLCCTLFALHPTRVESVVWVMQRKDLLYTLFYLLSLISYIYYIEKKKHPFIFLVVILCSWLASISKIQAVMLPLTLFLIDYYYSRRINVISVFEKIVVLSVFLISYNGFLNLIIAITICICAFYLIKIIIRTNKRLKFREIISPFIRNYINLSTYHSAFKKLIIILLFYILIVLCWPLFYSLISDFINFSKQPIVINYFLKMFDFFEKLPSDIYRIIANYWDITSSNIIYKTDFNFVDRIFLFSYAVIFYLYQFIFPFNLCGMHPYPNKINGFLPGEYYVSGILLIIFFILIILMIFKSRKKCNVIIFGLFFFITNVFIVGHLLPMQGRLITADRYAYLAYFGLFLIIAYLMNILISKSNKIIKRVISVLFICLIAAYSLYSHSRISVWENSYTFWMDIVNKQPENYYAYYGLGNYYLENSDFKLAQDHFNKAISVNSKNVSKDNQDPFLYNNLGLALYHQKEYIAAIQAYDEAIRIMPGFSQFYNNRGNAFYFLKEYDSALSDYNISFQKWNKNCDALLNKADLEFELGFIDSAKIHYLMCTEIDSNLATPLYKLGAFYFKQNNYDTARMYLLKAISKNPGYKEPKILLNEIESKPHNITNKNISIPDNNNAEYYVNKGLEMGKLENYKLASEYFSKAIAIDPKNAIAYKNRGNSKGALKDYSGSISDFNIAIELNPNDAGSYLNRGNSKFRLNDPTACTDWEKAVKLGNTKANDLLKKYCN
jgi:tetratricopeptide (TPR) repeat protein